MSLAFAEARSAEERGEPPIGAALVRDSVVIASAGNRTRELSDPTAHAEMLVIREAAAKLGAERLVGCDLYVTLEPCAMCAGAISHARLRRLYYAAPDPKGGAVDNGPRFFRQPTCHHAPEVYGGLRESEAAAMLQSVFRRAAVSAPSPSPGRGVEGDGRPHPSSGAFEADLLPRERGEVRLPRPGRRESIAESAYCTPRGRIHVRPPFRADHVGSFLRPERLRQARERFAAGHLPAAELHAIEDECIREVVRAQENVGLKGITDGEFRRTFFHVDFLERLEGVETTYGEFAAHFKKDDGTKVGFAPPTMHVGSKVKWVGPIQGPDFDFLKSATTRTPKVCIPAPSMLHFRGGREAISEAVYPNLEDFYDDLTAAYRAEVADLAARGLRYLQFDDTNLAYLCDPDIRARTKARGDDPDALDASLLPAHQRFDPRPAGGHDGLRPSLPRQFQERLGRAGRLRAGRRDPAQRDEDRRLLPRI